MYRWSRGKGAFSTLFLAFQNVTLRVAQKTTTDGRTDDENDRPTDVNRRCRDFHGDFFTRNVISLKSLLNNNDNNNSRDTILLRALLGERFMTRHETCRLAGIALDNVRFYGFLTNKHARNANVRAR